MKKTLRLYTDFVCPFCFIAEFGTVPRLVRDFDLELEWHGFELHPRTPRGGMPLEHLFPGADLPTLHERTKAFALGFGVEIDPPDHLSNTRRVLSAAEFARAQGALEPFRKAAFEANFRQGLDLEADDTLRSIAAAAGLDAEATLAAAEDPVYQGLLDQRQTAARRAGITGIPTFEFDGRRAVGCQPLEKLVTALGLSG